MDYIMRQIQIASLCIAKHLNLEQVVHEVTDPYRDEAANQLYKRLMDLLADGKINEAENLLFEAVENNENVDDNYSQLAFDFYLKMDQYNDDYLKLCNFSREEVHDGWAEITELFLSNKYIKESCL